MAIGKFSGGGDRVLGWKLGRYIQDMLGVAVHTIVVNSKNRQQVYDAVTRYAPLCLVYCCVPAENIDVCLTVPAVEIREYDFDGYCLKTPGHPVYQLGVGPSSLGIMSPVNCYTSRVDALNAIGDGRIHAQLSAGDSQAFLSRNSLFVCYSHYISDLPLYFFVGAAYLERYHQRDICIFVPPMMADFVAKLQQTLDSLKHWGVGSLVLRHFGQGGVREETVFTVADSGKKIYLLAIQTSVEDHERLVFASHKFMLATGDQSSGLCLYFGKLFLYELYFHKEKYFSQIEELVFGVAPDRRNAISDVFGFSRRFYRAPARREASRNLADMASTTVTSMQVLSDTTLRDLYRILDREADFPGAILSEYVTRYRCADDVVVRDLARFKCSTAGNCGAH